MKQLKTVQPDNRTYDEIEKEILRVFREEIYLPLIKSLGLNKIENTKNVLRRALQTGRVTFYRGVFSGKFNATISKQLKDIGAVWDARKKVYRLHRDKLPDDISMSISLAKSTFEKQQEKVMEKLNSLIPEEIAEKVQITQIFDASLFKIEKDFKQSIKNVTVSPDITDTEREIIAEEYTEDMRRYIKNFTEEETLKLRQQVEASFFKGNRYETLVKSIEKSYGVSTSKAKFLARQETKLMMASYKKARYKSAGIHEYKWNCVVGSPAHPVRHDHKLLDNTVQNYDEPPVTNRKTGARNNPGQDYGCRCYDTPIVRFQ